MDPKPRRRIKDPKLLKRFRMEHHGEPCDVDGCGRQGIHVHHTIFRSQGGPDLESNLVWLCGFHHDEAHGIRRIEP